MQQPPSLKSILRNVADDATHDPFLNTSHGFNRNIGFRSNLERMGEIIRNTTMGVQHYNQRHDYAILKDVHAKLHGM